MMTRGTNDDTLKNLLSPSVSDRKGTDRQRLVATDVNTARAATFGRTIISNGVRGRIGVDAETARPSSGSGRLESPMECPRRTDASVFGNTIGRLVTLVSAKLRMVLSTCVSAPAVVEFSANECSEIGMMEPKTPVKDTNPPLSAKTPSRSVKDPTDQSASRILLSFPNGTCHSFTRSISVASVRTQFSASFPRPSVVTVSERSPGQIYAKPSQETPPLPLTHILTPAEGYSLQPMRTCAPASQVSEAHGSLEGQVAEMEYTPSLPPLSDMRTPAEEVGEMGDASVFADVTSKSDISIRVSSSDRAGIILDDLGDECRNRGRPGGCFGSGSFEAEDENGNAESGDSEDSPDRTQRAMRGGPGLGRLSRSISESFLPGEGGGSWRGNCGGGGSGRLVGSERVKRNQVADMSQVGVEGGDRKVGGGVTRAWSTQLESKWEPRLGPIRELGSWGSSLKMSPQIMLMKVERARGNAKMRLMRSRLKSKKGSGDGREGMGGVTWSLDG